MISQTTTSTLTPQTLDTPEGSRLAGAVRLIADLGPDERDRMYGLLTGYFHNVTRSQFERDLQEKEWVILLTGAGAGDIRGFSTLMRWQTRFDDRPATIFFSGDTIIEREYWGDTVLPRLWSRHVFRLAETLPGGKAYWFLICSGYKTYRFLSVFFREFYPTYQRPTPPAIKLLLDHLGRQRFPEEYDPERGVVCFKQAMPLRSGIAEITARRAKDPHVAFFARANPGHISGDELACLTELTPANLTPAGRRMVGPEILDDTD